MHTPFTTPSGNMHGMPLDVSLGLDKQGRLGLEKAVNNVEPETEVDWKRFENELVLK